MDIEKANTEATNRMMEARPIVTGMAKAIEVAPGLHENMLLHAGPPVTWERMSGPMKGAMMGALIFEESGTQLINEFYRINAPNEYWVKLKILSPNELVEQVSFPVSCTP